MSHPFALPDPCYEFIAVSACAITTLRCRPRPSISVSITSPTWRNSPLPAPTLQECLSRSHHRVPVSRWRREMMFMTLSPYTRTSEDEVHSLGLGVSNGSHRALSDPLSDKSESIERACEDTSAEGTARCASVGLSLMSLSSRRWLLFGKGVIRSGWQPAVVIPKRRNSI